MKYYFDMVTLKKTMTTWTRMSRKPNATNWLGTIQRTPVRLKATVGRYLKKIDDDLQMASDPDEVMSSPGPRSRSTFTINCFSHVHGKQHGFPGGN